MLGACRLCFNIELGECVAECLFHPDSKNAWPCMLLSNIYTTTRWDDVEKVWTMMKERTVVKRLGWSWIEMNNKMHVFLVGDGSHPQTQKDICLSQRRLRTVLQTILETDLAR